MKFKSIVLSVALAASLLGSFAYAADDAKPDQAKASASSNAPAANILPLTPDASSASSTGSIPAMVAPPAPKIDAKGYVLIDAASGQIIAQENMNTRMPPASLTKLMTMYVTSSALKAGQVNVDDKVRITKAAWRAHGSRMFLKLGSQVPLKELIDGIITASGNDACVAIADYIAGNEETFSHLMNSTAKALGMKDSHFTDSTGMPHPNHYVTPHDVAVLTRALINHFPDYYEQWYHTKWIKFNGIRQPNRNRLLWRDPRVDGLKTGHTKAAGFCLVASAKNESGMRLISVVMGAPSDEKRASDSQTLLNYGFRFFENHELFAANTPVVKARVWYGNHKQVALGSARPLVVTVPVGQYSLVKAKTNITEKLKAPIKKGQVYGTLTVSLRDKVILTQPLIALQDVTEGGFMSRMIDKMSIMFSSKS